MRTRSARGRSNDDQSSLSARLRQIWETAARAGDPLPSEEALAAALGVSRPALREALVRLEAEGLVRRQIGAGTYPNVAALDMAMRLDVTTEYAEMVREAGFEPSVEVIEHGWITLGADDAAALAIAPGGDAYRTVKRWLADGTPAMLAIDVVPCPRREGTIDPTASVLDLAFELAGEHADWLCAWPEAVALPADAAAHLGQPARTPVLRLDQVGVSRRGTRLFTAREFHARGPLRYGVIRTVRRR